MTPLSGIHFCLKKTPSHLGLNVGLNDILGRLFEDILWLVIKGSKVLEAG